MGLALVGRQVIWGSILLLLFVHDRQRTGGGTRRTTWLTLSAGVLVLGLFAGVFAGVATVDLAVVYGVVLLLGVALMVLGTAVAGWMIYVGYRAVEVGVSAERRSEEKRMISGRGQGWGEGESWCVSHIICLKVQVSKSSADLVSPSFSSVCRISSPNQSMTTLPPFDLSLTPKSQHAHLPRALTPGLDDSRPSSWLTSPYRSGLPVPQLSFSNTDGSQSFPSEYDKTPTSWLMEPSTAQPTLSPFSYPSTSGGRIARSPTPDAADDSWQQVDHASSTTPGQESPLRTGPEPFAAVPLRGVSTYTAASTYTNMPLSPPPKIPLPPTPPLSDETHGQFRPSTSSRWTTTTGSGQTTEWTRPSVSEWTSSSCSTFGDVHYQAQRVPGTTTTAAFSASALGLSGTGDQSENEQEFRPVELSEKDVERGVVTRSRLDRKDARFFVSIIVWAWVIFVSACTLSPVDYLR